MRKKIHPKYMECVVTCACGNTFTTRSTVGQLSVEICGNCHPFFTGKQKFVDTAGRVEKFQKRYGWGLKKEEEKPEEEKTEAEEPAQAAPAEAQQKKPETEKARETKPAETKKETPASDSANS